MFISHGSDPRGEANVKYETIFEDKVWYSVTVEATDPEEACEIAWERFVKFAECGVEHAQKYGVTLLEGDFCALE